MAFAVPFLCYFQKLQLLVVKKFWTNFCCIVLLYLWAQKVCLRFLKSYFKLEILIFLSFVVSLLVDMFNEKAHFLKQKNISGDIRDTNFSRVDIENWRGKVLKGNSINGRRWSSSKLFVVQNYAKNVNGNVPLMCIFLVSLSSRCARFFLYRRYFILWR